MINEVCFKIDSKNLYIDEYLVELNIPIFFICKDDANKKYAVMCENTSTLEYLICSVSINSLIKMLKNELTLYDFIKQSTFKWIIKSGETFESDIIELVTNLPDDYYDLEKLAEIMVEVDGVEIRLASQDHEEHIARIDGKTYYVYIS